MRYINIDRKYKIGEDGSVVEIITETPAKIYTNSSGYKYLSTEISEKESERAVHRLVYKYFINSEIETGLVIDHIDGCRSNNHYTNLQKLTYSQNCLKKEGYSVKALFNIKTKKTFLTDNLHKFAKANNIDSSSLYKSIDGRKNSHCGFWVVKIVDFTIDLDTIVEVDSKHPMFYCLKELFKGCGVKRHSSDSVILGSSDRGEIFLTNNRKLLVEKYNMNTAGIQDALRGKVKRHKGFSMEYCYDASIPSNSIIVFKNMHEFNDYLARE